MTGREPTLIPRRPPVGNEGVDRTLTRIIELSTFASMTADSEHVLSYNLTAIVRHFSPNGT